MRVYRINQAAVLLRRDRGKSVLEIAAQMGYDSPGKFSTAFKQIMGVSPLTYRKSSAWLDKKHPDGKERK
jgi:AraC-like DNA-binding protein